jgi:hypothetical protein
MVAADTNGRHVVDQHIVGLAGARASGRRGRRPAGLLTSYRRQQSARKRGSNAVIELSSGL